MHGAIVSSVGGLIFGFNTAVISGATDGLVAQFELDPSSLALNELGFAVAIATVGTIIGALVAGNLADRFGRRSILYLIGTLFVLGSIGSAVASNYPIFIIFRLLGGIGVGMSSVVVPIYTAEISPAKVRGRLVGLV